MTIFSIFFGYKWSIASLNRKINARIAISDPENTGIDINDKEIEVFLKILYFGQKMTIYSTVFWPLKPPACKNGGNEGDIWIRHTRKHLFITTY